jgi:histidinol-phosphate aminotransferase
MKGFPMETISLDRNENHFGPAPACFQVLAQLQPDVLSTYSRSYLAGSAGELTERLALLHGVEAKHVIVGHGSEDLLKQIMHLLVPKGETVLMPAQSWWYYGRVATENGGTAATFSLCDNGHSFVYDAPTIIDTARRIQPSILLLASPNNPTGNRIAPAELFRILDALPDTTIVLDEAYAGFGDEEACWARDLLSRHQRLLILRTFSKYYALAGMRIGYALMGDSHTALARAMTRYLGVSRIAEAAACAALDSSHYYASVGAQICAERNSWADMLSRLPGHQVYTSEANFLFVRVSRAIRTSLRDELPRHGVLVKFLDEVGLDDGVRITVGTPTQNRIAQGVWMGVVDAMHAAIERVH